MILNAPDRPLVTFALFAYNQEQYIRAAVEGALSQTYEPLEIILSDDCSSDRTFEIMKEIAKAYTGKHKIILNQNPTNIGVGAHVNKAMSLSNGKYVVGAAGDDISTPARTSKIVDVFLSAQGKTLSVWSNAHYIDAAGELIEKQFPKPSSPYNERTMVRNVNPVIGATHAWDRKVFDFFGPLHPSVMFEDNAISFRSYLIGDVAFIDEDLVEYRVHRNNITNYTKKNDSIELCQSAAKRSRWAISGIDQRLRDLEIAKNNLSNLKKDYCILSTELKRAKAKISRRYRAYEKFPKFTIKDVFISLTDKTLLKIIFRSVKLRLEPLYGFLNSKKES